MRVVNFQLNGASPLFIYANLDKLSFLVEKVLHGTSGILFCHGSSSISWTSFWWIKQMSIERRRSSGEAGEA